MVVTGSDVYAVDQREHGRPPPVSAMDRTRELGVLAFEATPALHLGGAEAARAALDRAATLASAEMLGSADRVLSMAVSYAKDRVQFGKPIGSFQAVKHMLADALVDVEGMRSTAYYAAWCTAADDPDRSMSASMAKTWCSDASRRVMATGLQVHGGIGFTWEHDMHLYLKRAQLDQVSYGDAAFHRDRIADLLRAGLRAAEGARPDSKAPHPTSSVSGDRQRGEARPGAALWGASGCDRHHSDWSGVAIMPGRPPRVERPVPELAVLAFSPAVRATRGEDDAVPALALGRDRRHR